MFRHRALQSSHKRFVLYAVLDHHVVVCWHIFWSSEPCCLSYISCLSSFCFFFSLFALQVLVSMVMEEVMSYLKERKYFPGLLYNRAGGGNSGSEWVKGSNNICTIYLYMCIYAYQLLSEVYRTVKRQIKAAMAALKDELSLYRSDVEKLISAWLHPACLLYDHIAHTITGVCLCLWSQKMSKFVLHLD